MYLGIASLPELDRRHARGNSLICRQDGVPAARAQQRVGTFPGGDLGHGAVRAAEMLPAHAVSMLDRTGELHFGGQHRRTGGIEVADTEALSST
jgi:hypothetical protein